MMEKRKQATPSAVIGDWNQFEAFLAAQPLCRWSAEKQQEMASGRYVAPAKTGIHPPAAKNDNAELAAALSSMA